MKTNEVLILYMCVPFIKVIKVFTLEPDDGCVVDRNM